MPWIRLELNKNKGVWRVKINKRIVGTEYENLATRYLSERNVRITDKNFRNRFGEIDLIGYDEDYLVFFEVKYRRNSSSGFPEEAVTYKKMRNICLMAKFYITNKKIKEDTKIRFDVVAICGNNVKWIKNAFDFIN